MSKQAEENSLGELEAIKQSGVPEGIQELFRARWSPRSFSSRPVSDEALRLMLEASQWAASSSNEQPWRFIVARKSPDDSLYQTLFDVLDSYNQAWANTAPLLLLTVAKRDFTSSGKPNRHSMHDTGAALAHLMLQATALGLHAHGMAGFDVEKAHANLGIPNDYEPAAMVAVGYLGSPDDLPERYRERERAARQRRPLNELAFHGRWDEPLP